MALILMRTALVINQISSLPEKIQPLCSENLRRDDPTLVQLIHCFSTAPARDSPSLPPPPRAPHARERGRRRQARVAA
jgi:hypothetical protein